MISSFSQKKQKTHCSQTEKRKRLRIKTPAGILWYLLLQGVKIYNATYFKRMITKIICWHMQGVWCWFLAAMMSLIQTADTEPWPQTTSAPPLACWFPCLGTMVRVMKGGWGLQWGYRLERDRQADGILFVPLMWGLSFQQINARPG